MVPAGFVVLLTAMPPQPGARVHLAPLQPLEQVHTSSPTELTLQLPCVPQGEGVQGE